MLDIRFFPDEILLVDDDGILNLVHKTIIQRAGLPSSLQCFENGKAALDYIQHKQSGLFQKSLIFLDLYMPQCTGWEFLRVFKDLPPEIKSTFMVVVLSSSVRLQDRELVDSFEEVKLFIEKPLRKKDLEQAIDLFQAFF
ncbi:response regulator [Cecembia lonarensis]|uniref:Response regulator of citrate/malate metabolism n=1 Tax=Cecembia lonarensis (strain CCUG 58316 / KCTC 22772 / LW9) TaxID=1225176 RepID=K1LX09_CECL9|nr:response regulator [Cecembia lonarensis]EKB48699.1 Response regulator of citrate/malate metabolism [Cecembia lonarensis LW9]